MPTYRKVYNVISKCVFILHCAYFVFMAVSLFLPLWNNGDAPAHSYCKGWAIIIPILSLGFLGFGAWCALKSPESPLLSLGVGVSTYVGLVIMYIIPMTGWALGNMFDDGLQIAAGLMSRISENVFYAMLIIDVAFFAYSLVTFILEIIKPTKND